MHCIALGATGVAFPQNPHFLNKINLVNALKVCYLSSRPILRRIYKGYSFYIRREERIQFFYDRTEQ